MRRNFVLLLLVSMIFMSANAKADDERMITPTATDLQESYLRETAAAFFSIKCGIDKEKLMKVEMIMQLKQAGYWKRSSVGKNEWHATGEPRWIIHVKSFPVIQEPHEGAHFLHLDRSGKIIAWQAHGAEHSEINPDLMSNGSPAIPLSSDAQADEIIKRVQMELKEDYGLDQVDTLAYEIAFVYEEHFNWGQIPVWIAHVYDGEALAYKGVYAYDGRNMSLVPADQDFRCYVTPDEEFFVSVYGEHWADEAYKAASIIDGSASEADAREWLSDWSDLFREWAIQHPYSAKNQLVSELLKLNADLLSD